MSGTTSDETTDKITRRPLQWQAITSAGLPTDPSDMLRFRRDLGKDLRAQFRNWLSPKERTIFDKPEEEKTNDEIRSIFRQFDRFLIGCAEEHGPRLYCSRPVANEKCVTCGGERLEYKGLMLHDLRRTAARNLRKAGVAEGVIMRVGGWRTRSVFERYNIISPSDMQDAMRKLEEHRAEQGKTENSTENESPSQFGHDFSHDSDSALTARQTARIN